MVMMKHRAPTNASPSKVGRSCIFCGGRPVTREHILPMWIADLFRDGEGAFVGSVQITHEGQAAPPRRHESRTDILSPIRLVCACCNNGWMSDLEESARPLLEPMINDHSAVHLSEDEQGVIARWAAKTAILLGNVAKPPYQALPSRLDSIMRQPDGPPHSWIYLAAMQPGGARVRGQVYINRYTTGVSRVARGTTTIATVGLRGLVIQVLQMDLVPPVTARPAPSTMLDEECIRVWPSSPLLRAWPPSRSLSPTDFDRFATNFSEVNVRIEPPTTWASAGFRSPRRS
jgi:hypothetical protein